MNVLLQLPLVLLATTLVSADPVRLQVDFSRPDGAWNMPALALGQGGLQSDQLDGPRYKVTGEQGSIRAIAGDGDGYKHLIVWRYEDGGPEQVEVRLAVSGASGRSCRVVQLDAAASVNNLQVLHFGPSDDLTNVPLRLRPWDVRWVEIE
jgi:hypothetical protein